MSRFASVVVVVAIILLVVTVVIYPIVAEGPIINHKTLCLSNLKQSSLGSIMYTSDYDDRFPSRDRWVDATFPYTKNEAIYHCPEVIKTNPKQYGYSFNSRLSFAKTPKDADTVPLVYDSVNLARNASDPVTSLPDPPRHKEGTVNYMAYADGHAKVVKRP